MQADPGRPYEEALLIRQLIEDARTSVAGLASVTPRQVVFTSSIAESINHAVASLGQGGIIVASQAERTSTTIAAAHYGTRLEVRLTPAGQLDLAHLEELLDTHSVALVCAQVANHETGILNDVGRIVERAHAHGAKVHLDASMAFGHLPMHLGDDGADAVTVSSELIGGPQGVAALLVKKGSLLRPLLLGGAQERARRAGLENSMGIIGFGVAAEVLASGLTLDEEASRNRQHIALLTTSALSVPGVLPVGDEATSRRVPHVACFTIEGVEAEPVLLGLDRVGVSIHSGSACSSEALEPSPVLAAMGRDANRSLRLSVGWSTTDDDVNRFADVFPSVVEKLRSLRSDSRP